LAPDLLQIKNQDDGCIGAIRELLVNKKIKD